MMEVLLNIDVHAASLLNGWLVAVQVAGFHHLLGLMRCRNCSHPGWLQFVP